MVEGEDHGGGPVAQLQLGEHVVDVRLDRALADKQLGGDLGVGHPEADQRQHLTLPGGQLTNSSIPASPLRRGRPVDGKHPTGHRRVEPGPAFRDHAHCPVQIFGGHALEDKA